MRVYDKAGNVRVDISGEALFFSTAVFAIFTGLAILTIMSYAFPRSPEVRIMEHITSVCRDPRSNDVAPDCINAFIQFTKAVGLDNDPR